MKNIAPYIQLFLFIFFAYFFAHLHVAHAETVSCVDPVGVDTSKECACGGSCNSSWQPVCNTCPTAVPQATNTPVPPTNTPKPVTCSRNVWGPCSAGSQRCVTETGLSACSDGTCGCYFNQCSDGAGYQSCGGGQNPVVPTNTSTPENTRPPGQPNPSSPSEPTSNPTPTCPVLTKPTNLIATCDAQGNTVLKWSAVEGAQYYSIRVANQSEEQNWNLACPHGNANNVSSTFCKEDISDTSFTIKTSTKDSYSWWVHARCGSTEDWSNAPAEFGNLISCARPDKPILSSQVPVCSDDGWTATFNWQKPAADPRVDNFILRINLDNVWLLTEKLTHWFMMDGSDLYKWTGNTNTYTAQVIPFRNYEGWSVESMISTDPTTGNNNPDARVEAGRFVCLPKYVRPSGNTSNCTTSDGNLSEGCTLTNFIDEYRRQYGYDPRMASTARGNAYPNLLQNSNAYLVVEGGEYPIELIDLLDFEAWRYKKYHPVATPTLVVTATPTSEPTETPILGQCLSTDQVCEDRDGISTGSCCSGLICEAITFDGTKICTMPLPTASPEPTTFTPIRATNTPTPRPEGGSG